MMAAAISIKPHPFAAALLAIVIVAMTHATAMSQQAVVFVNGAPITTYDIEQRSKLVQVTTHKSPTRQEIIDDLINDKLKIQEAKRYGLEASDEEVERALAGMGTGGGRSSVAQLTQALAAAGLSIETLRSRVKAEIAWGQLVKGRFSSSLQADEKDILEALEAKKQEGESAAYDYSLRPILFIVPKGSPAAAMETRLREAEGLRARFQGCEEGLTFTRGLKDVAVRDPLTRTSADLPPPLREILDTTPVGRLTKPEATPQGIELFALCDKKSTTADTPQRRGARNQIISSRFDAQSKKYLREVRRGAMIEYK
ncbi:MAG: peptidyl-prolyl cis-trans isomerase SurA [Alphaproteobacteria bacterium]|jgi:peptidyl-prolyl cis-trans isomerase SurA|nr:peptidyl-prolyl cis-trans isomerase SurA [Alphaproteobacteria bacterium]